MVALPIGLSCLGTIIITMTAMQPKLLGTTVKELDSASRLFDMVVSDLIANFTLVSCHILRAQFLAITTTVLRNNLATAPAT